MIFLHDGRKCITIDKSSGLVLGANYAHKSVGEGHLGAVQPHLHEPEDSIKREEADRKRDANIQIRCYELWVKAGRPPNLNDANNAPAFGNYQNEAVMYRARGDNFYSIEGTTNAKEALGLLKDWSTSLVQLDLAAIGAIGLFIGFTDFARSPILGFWHLHGPGRCIAILELACIGLSSLSFFVSLSFGQLLLNALPGAIQRVPVGAEPAHRSH